MSNVIQTQFLKFHDTIKLNWNDENKVLREKRDIIISKIRENMKSQFGDSEEKTPTFEPFNQGSYAMHTGINPNNGDYDIDVGLIFNLNQEDYPDCTTVKNWIYNALNGHTHKVEIKKPCVRVVYKKQGEEVYHVDLAIYAKSKDNSNIFIAKGCPGSKEENKYWEISKPKEIIKLIENHLDNDDRQQFRRIVRYLKKWRDIKYSADGHSAPIGIAITICAYKYLQIQKTSVFEGYEYDDLAALSYLITFILNSFHSVYIDNEIVDRIVMKLPVEPSNDLFEKMSNQQMTSFKSKLEDFSKKLKDAIENPDPIEACKTLQSMFGDDFPVPIKKESYVVTSAPAIANSEDSA